MRIFLSGAFLLLGVFLVTSNANAALIQTDNYDITVEEGKLMRLDFAIEYNGEGFDTSPEDNEENDSASSSQSQNVVGDVSSSSTGSSSTVILSPGIPGDVVINEFVSDPESGQDEWIELYNSSDGPISLEGWYISEGSGKHTTLEGVLAPSQYLIVDKPSGSLNNGGDLIQLFDSFDTLMDDVVYGSFDATASEMAPAASDPDSTGRTSNGWVTMTPTPGTKNISPELLVTSASHETSTNTDSDTETDFRNSSDQSATETAESENADSTTEETADEPALPFVSLANLRSSPIGTELITEGIVSALPGVLGKQFFYIAGSGVQVYLHSADFPTLSRGMRVKLRGVISQISGEMRLKLTSTDAIQKRGIEDAPLPHDITSALVGEPTEGWLVRITGTVSEKTGNSYQMTDSDGSIRVTIKESTEIIPSFSVGDDITIVGIVSQTSSGYRILPRDQNDILIRSADEEVNDTTPVGTIMEHNNPTGGIAWIVSGIMVFLGIAALTLHRLKKRKLIVKRVKTIV
jgi:hypothetical protein